MMRVMTSQTTGVSVVAQAFVRAQIKENIKVSVSLSFVRGLHQWLVESLHKVWITKTMFPFHDVLMA